MVVAPPSPGARRDASRTDRPLDLEVKRIGFRWSMFRIPELSLSRNRGCLEALFFEFSYRPTNTRKLCIRRKSRALAVVRSSESPLSHVRNRAIETAQLRWRNPSALRGERSEERRVG